MAQLDNFIHRPVDKLIEVYGQEGWSSGVFITGLILDDWLRHAISHYEGSGDKNVLKRMKVTRKSLNDLLTPPRQTAVETGQMHTVKKLIGDHHDIIYQLIGIDDQYRINKLKKYLIKLNKEKTNGSEQTGV